MSERKLSAVPKPAMGFLALALVAQLGWHGLR